MSCHIEPKIDRIVDLLMQDYQTDRTIDAIKPFDYPDREEVIDVLEKLKIVIYPGYYRNSAFKTYTVRNNVSILLEDIIYHLIKQIKIVLRYLPEHENADPDSLHQTAEALTFAFLEKIPKIRALIETDIQAAYDGDPAAYNKDEIICTYPGLYAIFTNRIAHELFVLGVPLIPRIMTEHAHSLTGIDIHPGTTIGEYFFIDHGTGIVIGETTVIGNHVKLYQGVTLGAKSFELDENGNPVKNIKRHPNIGNHVVIYANATILGGDTYIGDNSVIGGNTWLTRSVEAGSVVAYKGENRE